ncbi:MAG: hypothetical protein O3A84_12640, partial [Proteobacteria bacterium]|nr:hypothetical protein [Pseudomonadota bacterium]
IARIRRPSFTSSPTFGYISQTIRVVDNGTDHDVSKHHHDIQVAPFAYVMALLAFSAFLILLGLIFRFFRTPFDGAER